MAYSQPYFVKFNNNSLLPINVRGKYFIYVIVGAPNIMGIPAMYVNLNSVSKLSDFINIICIDYNIIFCGTENFVLNEDYYLNEAISIENNLGSNDSFDFGSNDGSNDNSSDDLSSTDKYFNKNSLSLPVYWNYKINTSFFENLDNTKMLNYYINKNNYIDYTFCEDELFNFYSTFCKLIINLTTFNDYNLSINNQIYNKVLTYFANNGNDDALSNINIILNNLYSVNDNQSLNCGCNTSNSNDNLCSTSCSTYYKQAMVEYLKTMLGNYEFYNDWFYIDENEYNEELIYQLEMLINEFLSLDLNISLSTNTYNCDCPTVSNSDDSCNRGIISNFKKILTYVKENKLEENKNKIKIYGEKFGELLPNLQF